MAAESDASAFDAVVVGAGPAGSATARTLAQRGWRVALLEQSRFEAPRIGETLAPNVQESLRGLGLWSEFLALGPLPSWGTCSLWGRAPQQSHSHLLSPYGCGWHVERRAFDHMLARAAEEAGAILFKGVSLERNVHRDGHWYLRSAPAGRHGGIPPGDLRARVLVDGTGRQARVGRALGARRVLLDRLVGVAARCSDVDAARDGHLLVEAVPEGWWYSAPLPGVVGQGADAMIAVLMTDADLCRQLRLTTFEGWQAALRSTTATGERLSKGGRCSRPQVYCAESQRLSREGAIRVGPWLAVGDAALSVDPMSGSGIPRALLTARAAAATVSEILENPRSGPDALAAYEAERDEECTKYLLERAQYYAAEERFSTPFWRRRRLAETGANSSHRARGFGVESARDARAHFN